MPDKKRTFQQNLTENMKALGLDVPQTWSGSEEEAMKRILALAAFVKANGASVTLMEWLQAGPWWTLTMGEIGAMSAATAALEIGATYYGVKASFYLGALIGSVAVASGAALADSLFQSKNGSYPFHVVDKICSRQNVSVPDALYDSRFRPFPGKYVNWKKQCM